MAKNKGPIHVDKNFISTYETDLEYEIDALIALGRYDEAIRYIDEILRAVPNDLHFHFLRAVLLVMVGKLKDALEEFDRATNIIARSKGPSCIYYVPMGNILYAMGKHKEAMEMYEKAVKDCDEAIKHKPADEPAYRSHKGPALMMMGRREEATTELERVIAGIDKLVSLNPINFTKYYFTKLSALLELNRFEETISVIDSALNTSGSSLGSLGIVGSHYFKGLALLGKGDYKRALNELMCAYKLTPGDYRLPRLAVALSAASCAEGPESAMALLKRENVGEQALCGAMRELVILERELYESVLPACAKSFIDQFMETRCGGRPGAGGEPKERRFLFWRR